MKPIKISLGILLGLLIVIPSWIAAAPSDPKPSYPAQLVRVEMNGVIQKCSTCSECKRVKGRKNQGNRCLDCSGCYITLPKDNRKRKRN